MNVFKKFQNFQKLLYGDVKKNEKNQKKNKNTLGQNIKLCLKAQDAEI